MGITGSPWFLSVLSEWKEFSLMDLSSAALGFLGRPLVLSLAHFFVLLQKCFDSPSWSSRLLENVILRKVLQVQDDHHVIVTLCPPWRKIFLCLCTGDRIRSSGGPSIRPILVNLILQECPKGIFSNLAPMFTWTKGWPLWLHKTRFGPSLKNSFANYDEISLKCLMGAWWRQ